MEKKEKPSRVGKKAYWIYINEAEFEELREILKERNVSIESWMGIVVAEGIEAFKMAHEIKDMKAEKLLTTVVKIIKKIKEK